MASKNGDERETRRLRANGRSMLWSNVTAGSHRGPGYRRAPLEEWRTRTRGGLPVARWTGAPRNRAHASARSENAPRLVFRYRLI